MSGILKRSSGHEHEVSVDTNDEEESAYNEHFKNSAHTGPGEYRVPSVRVRPVQAMYTGGGTGSSQNMEGKTWKTSC